MLSNSKWHGAVLATLCVMVVSIAWQGAAADDMFHDISGVVKSVDKTTKTVVIKSADGTEHTIKYTSKTTVEGTKDAGKGVEKGSAETYF